MSEYNTRNERLNIIEEYIFYNNETHIFEKDYKEDKEQLVSNMILSLIKGSIDLKYEGLIKFLPLKMKDIVEIRWKAILKIFNNELEEAEHLLLQALTVAKSSRIEKWVRRDILLDLRNLEIEMHRKEGRFIYKGQRQKDLEAMAKWNYRPNLDWLLEGASFEVIRENFNVHTDTPTTVRFGGNLRSSLEKITKAFEDAICNGSYTFIHVIRERLAYILYNYGKIYEESILLYHSLKLFMIENKKKMVKKILDSEWEYLYKELIDIPSDLINLSFLNKDSAENLLMKCTIIEKLGPYFYEEEIHEVELFLNNCIENEFSIVESEEVKKSAISAYKDIINRINNEEILGKILEMLEIEVVQLDVYEEIIKLLLRIEWGKVESDICEELALIIYKTRRKAISESKVYFLLSRIKTAHPNRIKEIEEEMIGEWLSTKRLEISNYFSVQKCPSVLIDTIYEDILQKIKENNEGMTEGSGMGLGGFSIYHLLVNHIISGNVKDYYTKFEDIMPLYKEVLLNPYQSTSNKRECLESMIRLVKHDERIIFFITRDLKTVLTERKKDVLVGRSGDLFDKCGTENLELKLLELVIMLKILPTSINEVLAKCVEYGTHSFVDVRENALSLVRAISSNSGGNYKNEISQYLYSKTFDNWYKIRGDAIYTLIEVNHEADGWNSIVVNRVLDLIQDSKSYVRSSVIAAASKNIENEKYKAILAILKRDRHYKLREIASSSLT
ncbi:hypothetical protein CN297_11860 [Bacillus cereus]|uniref:HEAT repeat domain-containing protein n=1 Tax=Bacillus cereus TaxID=1396 RepID=UPI000BF34A2B|nr:HEAT repeat domain-containing protein [Bacillus cereus]MED2489853.1 HEAT repeat domain-containing protein [Bacillus thuringiensis]PFC52028.1 hypothetical protein CN297_11860 [Bacillus cereus]